VASRQHGSEFRESVIIIIIIIIIVVGATAQVGLPKILRYSPPVRPSLLTCGACSLDIRDGSVLCTPLNVGGSETCPVRI
jgi:hypothetical protein